VNTLHKGDDDDDDDNDNNNKTNAIQSQPSLTGFSVRVLLPSFAVSVHILQSLTYASSSPSRIPACFWLVGDCPTPIDVFYRRGKAEMCVRTARNFVFS
jgi:hypothetical protein